MLNLCMYLMFISKYTHLKIKCFFIIIIPTILISNKEIKNNLVNHISDWLTNDVSRFCYLQNIKQLRKMLFDCLILHSYNQIEY